MMQDVPRFMYVCGADGTGKSTQAQLVLGHLKAEGIAVEHRWVRFPFFLSIPLLAYAKLRGWSWYEQTGTVRHGYWDFRGSPVLRTLLPWTLLADAAIAALRRVYTPLWRGRTIVCERFVLDMLVDLSVAIGNPAIHRTIPGRLFPRLIPRDSGVAVMDLDAATIRSRRADLQLDRRLEERLAMFRILAHDLSLPIIRSSASVDEVNRHLETTLRQASHTQSTGSGYAKIRSAPLQRVLRHPFVGIASHWLVQSTTYMDRTERTFKLLLDGFMTLLFGLVLGRFLRRSSAWIVAFLLAHTVNFLFNGHLWGLLKHYNRVRTSYQDFVDYYEAFRSRVEGEPSLAYAAVYGSLARGDWKPSSDLDVRLVRRPGLSNAWSACVFTMRERSHALIHRFPLDIYVVDDFGALEAMGLEKAPTVLLDRRETSDE